MVETLQNSLLAKIAAYTQILAIDPRSTIFVSLSEAYRKMGMFDDAYSIATQGLEVLPDYCPGHVVLARIKCQQGDLAGSENSFSKALSLDNNNLAALVGFSRLRLIQERQADARELLLRARDLAPADSVINKLLLSLPETIVEPAPEPYDFADEPSYEGEEYKTSEPFESATLADLYRKQGLPGKALEIYRNLLLRDPDNLDYRRCIRDLEQEKAGVDVSPQVSFEAGTALDSELDASPADGEGLGETDTRCQIGPQDGGLSVLAQLNRFLTSAQKRRGDV
jgi:tetratricopeptide (TPR) repeat protein